MKVEIRIPSTTHKSVEAMHHLQALGYILQGNSGGEMIFEGEAQYSHEVDVLRKELIAMFVNIKVDRS